MQQEAKKSNINMYNLKIQIFKIKQNRLIENMFFESLIKRPKMFLTAWQYSYFLYSLSVTETFALGNSLVSHHNE